MSAFASAFQSLPAMNSGASQQTGAQDNRSVNIFAGGGTDAGLNQLLQLANGPSSNGGVADSLLGTVRYNGLTRQDSATKNSGWILWGCLALAGFLLLKNRL